MVAEHPFEVLGTAYGRAYSNIVCKTTKTSWRRQFGTIGKAGHKDTLITWKAEMHATRDEPARARVCRTLFTIRKVYSIIYVLPPRFV